MTEPSLCSRCHEVHRPGECPPLPKSTEVLEQTVPEIGLQIRQIGQNNHTEDFTCVNRKCDQSSKSIYPSNNRGFRTENLVGLQHLPKNFWRSENGYQDKKYAAIYQCGGCKTICWAHCLDDGHANDIHELLKP